MNEKKYGLYNTKQFENDLSNLDKVVRERVIKKLSELESNPYSFKALHGNLKGKWSMRVGDYRVVYEINEAEKKVISHYVEHRGTVYD